MTVGDGTCERLVDDLGRYCTTLAQRVVTVCWNRRKLPVSVSRVHIDCKRASNNVLAVEEHVQLLDLCVVPIRCSGGGGCGGRSVSVRVRPVVIVDYVPTTAVQWGEREER